MDALSQARRAWAQAVCPDVVRELDALDEQIEALAVRRAELEARLPGAQSRGVPLHLIVYLNAIEAGEGCLDIAEADRRVADLHTRLLQQFK